ncbi:GTPase HflX [Thermosulfurimonas dismutans]|uniref:GTPase HflX n=1 Tax=Thermosulfurimonas dismutans TaxID=999894 RepID=A0A179D3Q9_9BACT|nr:GTPase HflX [Thermosulfurimonas dismutans]OAQ20697.1 GTP-binding protein HflX [Thermosulfurimonas dismutans]
MAKTVYGHISGLKPSELRALERLYRRRVPADYLITHELSRELSRLSFELNRQLGLLINRRGEIEYVIVGDYHQIVIPAITRSRKSEGRLKGLRCVHTHLSHEGLDQDDLLDLAFLRLDCMSVLEVGEAGLPGRLHTAYLLPQKDSDGYYGYLSPVYPWELKGDFREFIESLEEELERVRPLKEVSDREDRALLVEVHSGPKFYAEERLSELRELARTAGVTVVGEVIQRRDRPDPRYVVGKGKLSELIIQAMQTSANLLIFDCELTPSQVRALTEMVDLRVIDRTQLILDIFAQRAKSREGKIQVEMAQLRYMLPRLRAKDDAFSRLTGGIGARGPGETKLEVDRRRIRERIARLERELKAISRQRELRRKRRKRHGLPVVAIIGYTNAGKTTLLNTLAREHLLAEDKLFATLDPVSRRIRLPDGKTVLFTDTVGFIRELPKDLKRAFQATLEELYSADLLLHLVDISHPDFEEHIKTVEEILEEMGLSRAPRLLVFNKIDKLSPEEVRAYQNRYHAEAISALNPETLPPLLSRLATFLDNEKPM